MEKSRGNIFLLITGSELTSGRIQDSNSLFLADQLRKQDFSILGNAILPDDPSLLTEFIGQFFLKQKDLDLLVMTGGLGPTQDDLTVDLLANLFQQEILYHQPTIEQLKDKFRENYHPQMQRQTRFLKDSQLLLNDAGCAPGFLFRCDQKNNGDHADGAEAARVKDAHGGRVKYIATLPGVPYEMKKMVTHKLLAELEMIFPTRRKIYSETINLLRIPEAKIENDFLKKFTEAKNFQLSICASRGALTIRLTATQPASIANIHKKVKETYFEHYCPQQPKNAFRQILLDSNLTVATAESCTGGCLAAELTANHGASRFFQGSIIAYQNEIKKEMLAVANVGKYGPVSKETTRDLAVNVREKFKSNIGIGITGWAGSTREEITEKKGVPGKFFISISVERVSLKKSLLRLGKAKCWEEDFANSTHGADEQLNFFYEGMRPLERAPFIEMVTNMACFLGYFVLANGRMPKI